MGEVRKNVQWEWERAFSQYCERGWSGGSPGAANHQRIKIQ